ncbi:hypothetical protein GCM10009845_23010 [Pedococcus bigeumensis]
MERRVGSSKATVAHTVHMPQRGEQQRVSVVGMLSLALLIGSGLVLATSFLIPWPPVVGLLAILVGLLALAGVVVVGFRGSRRSGQSVRGAVGQSGRDGLRFLRDFL